MMNNGRTIKASSVSRHAAERAGDSVLGPDDVVVESAAQRTGLGAGEERHGHALDLGEQRNAQVVDQPFSDARRTPALHDRQPSVGQCGDHYQRGEPGDLRSVLVGNRRVDDLSKGERGDQFEQGGHQDRRQEHDDDRPVRPGEPPRPADGAALQPGVLDGVVVARQQHVWAHSHGVEDTGAAEPRGQ
jgi:hypothetical protein